MADQTLVKRINRARIMNAIRLHSPISRSEIARGVGLDRKTITNLVAELVADGAVLEVGRRKAEKGRPVTLLEFDRDRRLALGISLAETKVTGKLLNLYGQCVAERENTFPFDGALDEILGSVKWVYDCLRAVAGDRIDGVGFAVPGIIDLGKGLVHRSVNIRALNDLNVKEAVSSFIEEPLFLEEGSRAKALAEKWFGLGQRARSFVCVDLGIGIGAGIVQDGRLYCDGMAFVGEIGHIIIEKDGRPCRCGHCGCLEAYLSDVVLLRQINEAEGTAFRDLEEIRTLGPKAGAVIRGAGRQLGFALSYLVNIICPPLLVINGALMKFREVVVPEVRRGIDAGALPAFARTVRIVPSELASAAALGAAARALSEVFEVEGHCYV